MKEQMIYETGNGLELTLGDYHQSDSYENEGGYGCPPYNVYYGQHSLDITLHMKPEGWIIDLVLFRLYLSSFRDNEKKVNKLVTPMVKKGVKEMFKALKNNEVLNKIFDVYNKGSLPGETQYNEYSGRRYCSFSIVRSIERDKEIPHSDKITKNINASITSLDNAIKDLKKCGDTKSVQLWRLYNIKNFFNSLEMNFESPLSGNYNGLESNSERMHRTKVVKNIILNTVKSKLTLYQRKSFEIMSHKYDHY